MNDNNNGKQPLNGDPIIRVLIGIGCLIAFYWLCRYWYASSVVSQYYDYVQGIIGGV